MMGPGAKQVTSLPVSPNGFYMLAKSDCGTKWSSGGHSMILLIFKYHVAQQKPRGAHLDLNFLCFWFDSKCSIKKESGGEMQLNSDILSLRGGRGSTHGFPKHFIIMALG